MTKEKQPVFNFNEDKVTLTHTSRNNAILEHHVDFKTKVMNKSLGLKSYESLAFRVPNKFETDGATTQMVVFLFVTIQAVLYFLGANATTLYVSSIVMMLSMNTLYSYLWHLLIPAIGHDYLCRYSCIREAYVIDDYSEEVIRELGEVKFPRHKADIMMFNKIGSFRGYVARFLVFPAIFTFGKLFK